MIDAAEQEDRMAPFYTWTNDQVAAFYEKKAEQMDYSLLSDHALAADVVDIENVMEDVPRSKFYLMPVLTKHREQQRGRVNGTIPWSPWLDQLATTKAKVDSATTDVAIMAAAAAAAEPATTNLGRKRKQTTRYGQEDEPGPKQSAEFLKLEADLKAYRKATREYKVALYCPLLKKQARFVAMADDGYFYDKASLKRYILDNMAVQLVSPVTGAPMLAKMTMSQNNVTSVWLPGLDDVIA